MYVNAAFKTDDEAAWAFVAERGFGSVVAVDAGRPVASQVPLLVVGEGASRCIEFHLARANPLHEIIAAAPQVTVIVAGPDAYISPDWYGMEDQVPTWNYVAVHITGQLRLLDQLRLRPHLEELSARFENRLAPKKPWTLAKMSDEALARLMRMIVPVAMTIEGIDSTIKLSQNKTPAARAGAAAAIEATRTPGQEIRTIAQLMRDVRTD